MVCSRRWTQWLCIVFLLKVGQTALQPSILTFDDEDLTPTKDSQGSGDESGSTTIGEIVVEALPTFNIDLESIFHALISSEGSGSGAKAGIKPEELREEAVSDFQNIPDMFSSGGEEFMASAEWSGRVEESGDFSFSTGEAFGTGEDADEPEIPYGFPTDVVADQIDSTGSPTANSSYNGENYQIGIHLCSNISNPCGVNETCVVYGSAAVCQNIDQDKRTGQDPCQQQPCLNDGICYTVSDELYRCECPQGFSGPQCEASRPCSSDACAADCQCFESSHHKQGYYCLSPRGLTGNDCNIPLPEVNCGNNEISLNVSRMFLDDLEAEYGPHRVFLSDVPGFDVDDDSGSCEDTDGVLDWQPVIPSPFKNCGTVHSGSGNYDIVRDGIWTQGFGNSATNPTLQTTFECRYKTVYHAMNYTVTTADVDGELGSTVQLCKIKSCPHSCPIEHLIDADTIFEANEIHLTISSETKLADEILAIESMRFTCDDGTSAVHDFKIVDSGCSVKPGSHVETSLGSVTCLSVRIPRDMQCVAVSIHIGVTSCPKADVEICTHDGTMLRCGSGTLSRRFRRSPTIRAEATIGPFRTQYINVGEASVIMYPDVGVKGRDIPHPVSDTSGRRNWPLFVSVFGILVSLSAFLFHFAFKQIRSRSC